MIDPEEVERLADVSVIAQQGFEELGTTWGEVQASKEALAQAELRHQRAVMAAAPSMTPEQLRLVYWFCPWIKAAPLSAGLGMAPRELLSIVGTMQIAATCPTCRAEFAYSARSRTQIKPSGTVQCLACCPSPKWGEENRLPSRRDVRRIAELRAMSYEDYLRTPEWAQTRQGALERALHMCQVCCGRYRLEVHHRTYDRFGTEQPYDLIVLCHEHHELFHTNGKLRR